LRDRAMASRRLAVRVIMKGFRNSFLSSTLTVSFMLPVAGLSKLYNIRAGGDFVKKKPAAGASRRKKVAPKKSVTLGEQNPAAADVIALARILPGTPRRKGK
jgi:hypothetical protein